MPIQIEIKDEYIKSITEFYGNQLKAIRDKKIALDKEEKGIEEIINQLHQRENTSIRSELPVNKYTDEANGYNSKWTILEKIKFILKENKEGMTSREIVDRMLTLDPALNANKNKTAKNISTILSINNGTEFKRDAVAKSGKINVYNIK